MNPTTKGGQLLGCIGKVVWAGGSCHRQFKIFVVLVVPSSHKNLKFLRVNKTGQEAFDAKIY
jgi:hypothetical protein